MSEKPTYEELEQKVRELESAQEACMAKLRVFQQEEKRYRHLFENMLHEVHVWKLVYDDYGNIKTWKLIDANPAALKSWNKSLSEVVGKTTDDIFPNSNATERFMPVVKKLFATRTPHMWESYFPDTNQILHMISIPFGEYFINTGLDTTDRKQAEEQLRAERDFIEHIMEISPVGITRADSDGRVIYANQVAQHIFGLQLAEIETRTFDDPAWQITALDGSPFPKEKLPFTLVKQTGKPVFDINHAIEWPNGRRVLLSINASPILNEKGQFEGIISAIEDITEKHATAEKYERLFNEMINGFALHEIICDEQGDPVDYRFLDVNPAFERITGLEKDALLGKTVLEVLPNTESYWIEKYGDVALTGKSTFFENYSLELDRHFKVTAFSPEPHRFACIFDDITDQKKAEKALRESEEKFRELSSMLPQIVFETDARLNLTFANKNAFSTFLYTEEELEAGLNALQMISPSDRTRAGEMIHQVMGGNADEMGNEYLAVKKDGTEFPVLIYSSRILRNELPSGIRGVMIDISDRKLAEKRLRENEAKFRNLFELSPQAIALTEVSSGRLIDVNNKLCELTKYSRDEILGNTTTEMGFYSHKDRDRFVSELKKFGHVNGLEMEFYAKDGVVLTALMFAKFIKIQDTPHILTIFHDITEQKHLKESIAQAQKMESIGSLAGGIAHDFNNILFPIIGMAEMMVEDLPNGSSVQQNAREIFRAGQRGSDLVKQILAFSRQSERKLIPTRAQKVLEDVLRLCRRTIPTDIEIEQQIGADCGLVMADPTQLHQVGMNLITNAFHAVEESSGKISVVLEEVELDREAINTTDQIHPGLYVKLTVSDNGVGIDPSIMDKIFDPYFTTKAQGRGTGLGLAVVYGIIKDWGGEIAVHSELGIGTTFELFLPVIKDSKEPARRDAHLSYLTGTETILLVDDDEAVAGLEKQILERLGYKVVMRTASLEAVKAFRSDPKSYNLVISDMSMPNMTGDRFSKEILEIRPDIPIILCTGFSERINQQKADEIGVKGLLMKPFTMSDLSVMVRKVLDEAQNRTKE